MRRKYFVCALPACILTGILVAQNWLQKPYTEWSAGQIDQVLNSSSWVNICLAGQKRGQLEGLQAAGVLPAPMNYRIRLLTARPIREAFLSEISLGAGTGPGGTVDVESAKAGGDTVSNREERVKRFADANPNDIRVGGDDENIVVAITLTQFFQSWVASQYETNRHSGAGSDRSPTVVGEDTRRMLSDWKEEPRPAGLMDLQLPDLKPKTFLSTKTGKRVGLAQYDPPGADMLGARFGFPRKLPDGSLFVTAGDQELQFETEISGRKVRVKFDLKKLIYKGKLEL